MPETTIHKVRLPDRPVKPRQFAETVPAIYAQVCLDCEKPGTIWDLRHGACPSCGSRASLAVRYLTERRSA